MGAFCLNPASESRAQTGPPDFTIRIASVEVEIAPKHFVKTTGYNGSVPGPVLRMPEGRPVTVDVYNDTGIPELVHWHGQFVPPEVDGSAEEGTPFIPAHSHSRYQFVPRPAGTRWYHSHIYAGRDLHRATYTGQFGFLQVVPKDDRAAYDQEVLLALHGWNPFLTAKAGGGDEGSLEVGYDAYTVNAHALGAGEPIRVKAGQRVLFRFLNANATLVHRLALPGHKFTVVSLDGNPVPVPRPIAVLELASAERVDALVEMQQPGVWILGDVDDTMRKLGLGIVVEYAGSQGPPQWIAPDPQPWDYTAFGRPGKDVGDGPAEPIPLVIKQKWAGNRWVDHWTINGKEYPKTDPIRVRANGRYRLIFDNRSDDAHPVHLHRHSFELVRIAGKPTGGIMKDVVNVQPRTQTEVEFVADNPGPSLFHCHMQLHMDFGFMALVEYSSSA
jgi:FtsP/CotA-like multicopper oxidase with cupredoxin domain